MTLWLLAVNSYISLMSAHLIFETTSFRAPACTVVCSSAGYVRLDWTDAAVSAPELQEIYEQVLAAMRRLGLNKLLSNHAQRHPIPATIQQWLTQEWVPKAIREAGYGYCAIVESQEAMGRLAARAIGSDIGKLISFRYFPTVAEAAQWLTAQ